jgi:hypothetical protein
VPRHPEMLPEPFGWEMVMDLHGCDPAVIGSRRALRRYRNAGTMEFFVAAQADQIVLMRR